LGDGLSVALDRPLSQILRVCVSSIRLTGAHGFGTVIGLLTRDDPCAYAGVKPHAGIGLTASVSGENDQALLLFVLLLRVSTRISLILLGLLP